MPKIHCYPIFFLLGSFFPASLYAAHYKKDADQDDYKYEEKEEEVSEKSFYTHGDLTFIHNEQHKINQAALQQGLIALSQQIIAKDRQKVYFLIGGPGSGKQLAILGLKGYKIKRVEVKKPNNEKKWHLRKLISFKKTVPRAQYKGKYVLLNKKEVVEKDSLGGSTKSTMIHYPDPRKPKYKEIAFADTAHFFEDRKATSAEKCLAALSLFYTLKMNRIGGIVLVLSALNLGGIRGKVGLMCFAHLLQTYFPKAMYNKSIKQSVLLMITNAPKASDRAEALTKLRQVIQQAYQRYYRDPDSDDNRCLQLVLEMLLVEDVPKDQINNLGNFTLDKQHFCFILPWEAKSVQKILDIRLSRLQSIPADALSTFDNPVSQYIEARLRCISGELNTAIQPLLGLKWKMDTIAKRIKGMQDRHVTVQEMKALQGRIDSWCNRQCAMQQDNTLEAVFKASHYEGLPLREKEEKTIHKKGAYTLCKAFQYRGREPICKIVATYGPGAELSEYHPCLNYCTQSTNRLSFIAKHFNISTKKHPNGMVTFKAVAKHGSGVVQDDWLLYHVTKGHYKAECEITFHTLKRARLATQKIMLMDAKRVKSFMDKIVAYSQQGIDCHTLASQYDSAVTKWKQARYVQVNKWKATAAMLQLFAHKILKKGANKALIEAYLSNFGEATQLKYRTGNPHQKSLI